MAFTATQFLSIVKITGVDAITLQNVLDYYATDITSNVETAVIAEILRWDAGAGADFVSVEPNLKNFGARIEPERAKNDIRKNIANMLFLTTAGVASQGSRLVRA